MGRKRAYQSCWWHSPQIREGGGKAERGRLLPVQRKEWKEESTQCFFSKKSMRFIVDWEREVRGSVEKKVKRREAMTLL